MSTVYRSARIVLQNNTDELLTLQGAESLWGDWSAGFEGRAGDQVEPQSARVFATESTDLQVGTSAFLHVASTRGHFRLSWSLPWVGEFTCEVTGSSAKIYVDSEEPAAIVAVVVLPPRRRIGPRATGSRVNEFGRLFEDDEPAQRRPPAKKAAKARQRKTAARKRKPKRVPKRAS